MPGAPTELLEGLLDALGRRFLLLHISAAGAALDQYTTPDPGDVPPEHVHGVMTAAAERLAAVRFSVSSAGARLLRGGPEVPQPGAMPPADDADAVSPFQAGAADRGPGWEPVELPAQTQGEGEGEGEGEGLGAGRAVGRVGRLSQGLRRMLPRGQRAGAPDSSRDPIQNPSTPPGDVPDTTAASPFAKARPPALLAARGATADSDANPTGGRAPSAHPSTHREELHTGEGGRKSILRTRVFGERLGGRRDKGGDTDDDEHSEPQAGSRPMAGDGGDSGKYAGAARPPEKKLVQRLRGLLPRAGGGGGGDSRPNPEQPDPAMTSSDAIMEPTDTVPPPAHGQALGAARLAGDVAQGLRRLIGGPRGGGGNAEAATAAAAADAAAESAVALGLAAFAVSAFVKSVLCPALSAYTPRVSTASLAGAFEALGAQGSLGGGAVGGPMRALPSLRSLGSLRSRAGSDDHLMHELDQVPPQGSLFRRWLCEYPHA